MVCAFPARPSCFRSRLTNSVFFCSFYTGVSVLGILGLALLATIAAIVFVHKRKTGEDGMRMHALGASAAAAALSMICWLVWASCHRHIRVFLQKDSFWGGTNAKDRVTLSTGWAAAFLMTVLCSAVAVNEATISDGDQGAKSQESKTGLRDKPVTTSV